jgi:hypothetical protein
MFLKAVTVIFISCYITVLQASLYCLHNGPRNTLYLSPEFQNTKTVSLSTIMVVITTYVVKIMPLHPLFWVWCGYCSEVQITGTAESTWKPLTNQPPILYRPYQQLLHFKHYFVPSRQLHSAQCPKMCMYVMYSNKNIQLNTTQVLDVVDTAHKTTTEFRPQKILQNQYRFLMLLMSGHMPTRQF